MNGEYQVSKPESKTNASVETETLNWLDEKGRVIEPLFADYFLERHPMRCFHDQLFTVDGIVDDEAAIKKEIYELVRAYVQSNVARKIDQLLRTIKLSCASEPPEIQTDRIHVANGTLFLDGSFSAAKNEIVRSRFPVAYNPSAPSPETWLGFLHGLLCPAHARRKGWLAGAL